MGLHLFLLPNNIFYINIEHFVYLSVDGNLGCFHLLAIIINIFMIICIQFFEWTYVFISLEYIHRSRIAGSSGNSMFNILKKCQTVLQVAASFCDPTSNIWELQFLHSLVNTIVHFFILTILMAVNWYLLVVLICIFLMTNAIGHIFMWLLSIWISLLENHLLKSFVQF